MARLVHQLTLHLLAGLLGLGGGIAPGLSKPTTTTATAKNQKTVRVTFVPPNKSKPNDTAGGASRGQVKCPQDPATLSPELTPVIPESHPGLTVAAHPTLWVYLPQTSAPKAFFSIQDEKNNQVYQTTLSLPQKPGIISLPLPADTSPLEVGQVYKWSFVLMCNNVLRPDSPLAGGMIERVALQSELSRQLREATPLEQAALYGKAGIWYETLSTLAQLKQGQTQDANLRAIWSDLLTSVKLEAIADQPLIP